MGKGLLISTVIVAATVVVEIFTVGQVLPVEGAGLLGIFNVLVMAMPISYGLTMLFERAWGDASDVVRRNHEAKYRSKKL